MDNTNDISSDELIEKLKNECKRVKIQRNEYEKKLIYANRKINNLETEIEFFAAPLQQRIKELEKEIERLTELLHNVLDIEDF